MIGVLTTTFKNIFRHEAHTIDLVLPIVFEANDPYSIDNGVQKFVVKRMQRTSGEQQVGYTTQHDQKGSTEFVTQKEGWPSSIPCYFKHKWLL